MVQLLLAFTLLQTPAPAPAAPTEADFVIRNFRFASGETLPELRLHYRTLGTPRKDAQGVVRNAVLIMHGTGGTGAQFIGAGLRRRAVPAAASCSTPRATSSSCPTTSATASRASRATACTRGFRTTAIAT